MVDSNVLLDLITEDACWFPWSPNAVERAADTSRLVLNPIVYAEISLRYARAEDLDAVLPSDVFEREAIPYERPSRRASASRSIVGAGEPSRPLFRTSSSELTPRSPAVAC